MRPTLLFASLCIFAACKETPTFQFQSTTVKPVQVVAWDNRLVVTDQFGALYEVIGDSLKRFDSDSILSITKCHDDYYTLKAPNDTTLVIVNSKGTTLTVKNRTGLSSKYFSLRTNETCDLLLESGTLAFKIQDNSIIDLSNPYGFPENKSPNGSDRFGYFENFIFLTKYPDYFQGGIFQSYLDKNATTYSLPSDLKVRDFTIHRDELLLATGFYDILNNEQLVERKILKLKNGKSEELVVRDLPKEMDIARIYSDGNTLYLLSERFGFFKLNEGRLEELVAINLKSSHVIPESFIVFNNQIYLSTFEHGLIRFTIEEDFFGVRQILTTKETAEL